MSTIDLYEAMSTLRAVRRLKPDPIPEATLNRVLEAASWAPTGGNVQPFRIIVVRDRAKLGRLGELYGTIWADYAAARRRGFDGLPAEEIERQEKMFDAGNYLADHFAEMPALLVFCFNPKNMAITDAKLDRISVVGGGSIYTAVQNVLLACRAEGLGCVLTTLLCQVEPEVRELLAIPDPWGTAAAIPIGYPVLGGHGPLRRRALDKLAFADEFGAPLPTGAAR